MSYVAPGENPTTIVICCAPAEVQARTDAVRMMAAVAFFMRTPWLSALYPAFWQGLKPSRNSDLHLSAFVSAQRYRLNRRAQIPDWSSCLCQCPFVSFPQPAFRPRRFRNEETDFGKHSAFPRLAGARGLRRGPVRRRGTPDRVGRSPQGPQYRAGCQQYYHSE